MAKSLVDFLEELDTNSTLMEAYKQDPVGTARGYDLSEADVKLIEEQRWDQVRQQFEDLGKSIKVIID